MSTLSQDTSVTNAIIQYTKEDYKVFPSGKGKGLVNLSNTCYMNSAIQSFLHTHSLSLWFLKGDYKEDLNDNKHEKFLVQAWSMLVREYFGDDKASAISPSAFHNVINLLAHKKHIPLYQLGNQNDIHEFILFFISNLHEAVSYGIKASIKGTLKTQLDRLTLDAHKQWAKAYRHEYSSIVELFYGQFISTITCPDCGTQSTTFEPECCFQLPIPLKRGNSKEPLKLIDCWRKFTELETMDKDNLYNCDKCKESKKATKQMALWKTPEILIIQLKRFRTHNNHSAKISDLVTYPIELNLAEFCSSYDKLKSRYVLYSVCNHQGATGGGHYFSYSRDVDNKWRKYNDSSVSEMDEEDVVTKDAYCLFYRKE